LAPWILLFLIPAVCMRSFSDEKKQGTLELLLTKPISHFKIVLGKYLGAFLLVVLALIPTLLYLYTVHQLGNPAGNLDIAAVMGSYFGLLFLIAAYTAIGIFASTISDNQIVAFIIGVFLCFLFYIGFDSIADFVASTLIENLGMNAHYKSMSRGVLDTRDIIYFLSITLFFLLLTVLKIKNEPITKTRLLHFLSLPLGLLVLNVFSQSIYQRFDMTEDHRYTLSQSALNTIETVESPIIIDVFLEGEFPSEFRRLQSETRQLLEEFSAKNSNIKFSFLNPMDVGGDQEQTIRSLEERGMKAMRLTVNENGKTSNEAIFPWALASYNDQTVIIPLVKNKIGADQQELVSNSVQHLEYAFADGFSKLVNTKKQKIAILRGNGQLEDRYLADFLKTIGEYYFIAPFTLDKVDANAQGTLDDLNKFDLVISAKPTKAFNEKEKMVLDQYTMNGGKSIWLVESVAMDKDSLFNDTGSSIATPLDLNLNDFFFKYGVRINPVMINDLYSAPITLAIGEGSESQFQPVKWPYSPLASNSDNHPIVNNLNLVKFDFANQIDTLKNAVKKTILLKSSPLSKLEGTPREIRLDMVTKEPDPSTYTKGNQALAVLLEGRFTSVYNNRVKPFQPSEEKNESIDTKMVIIADGDVIKNEVSRNGPQELGFDRWTGQVYGNKEFLLNTVNYLLDDDGLIDIRSKEVTVAFLDPQKIASEKTKWQLVNILLPLVLLAAFGFIFNYLRKRKYAS